MFEHIVLGAIQGLTEWLPISSKGCVMAAKVYFFHSNESINELINYALILHLGTFFAAVIYFWTDITAIVKSAFSAPHGGSTARSLLIFLVITTLLTALGQFIMTSSPALAYSAPHAKAVLMSILAALFIVAGVLQIKTDNGGRRPAGDAKITDGIFLGFIQALAALPGFSRTGATMAALLLRGFDKDQALKLSFLMSLPVILISNIIRNYERIFIWGPQWIGVLTAFIVGILSLKTILSLAKRVNFGGFLIFIGGILTIAILTGMLD